MTRRIFRNMALANVFAVLLTALIIIPTMYAVYEKSLGQTLEQEAECIAAALETAEDDIAFIEKLHAENRITLIDESGIVVYDNKVNAKSMENHTDRPEVITATEQGRGSSFRNSSTLSEITLYYAVRMQDGSIIRLANTRRSIIGTFIGVLPLIAGMLMVVFIISLLISSRTAKRIVAPINALNLDAPLENDSYDELAPLLGRMHQQRIQIDEHVQALEKAKSELTVIMQNMREGMVLMDQTETVLYMNESAGKIYGIDAEKTVGKKLLHVNRDADLHDLVKASLAGKAGNYVAQYAHRYYQVCASPVIRNQSVHGTALLLLDVTARYEAEESRREFTANVSHELKTPLTSISGFAEIIRDGIAKAEDVPNFAGMICKESTRLITLVNDILDLSQLDERQNLGQREGVALLPMLKSLLDDFTMLADKKRIALSLSGCDAEVNGYPKLMREMFFNLIDNAIKYTPDAGNVFVKIEKVRDKTIVSVRDTGIGIQKQHQSRVFERFYRVDKSHSKKTGGTGLGLAIVKHIAKVHDAEIELESAAGEGSEFRISFGN